MCTGGDFMSKKLTAMDKCLRANGLTLSQIQALKSPTFKPGCRPGLPVITDKTKEDLINSLKNSLIMQALGYHIDTTEVTKYYDKDGNSVNDKNWVHSQVATKRSYVKPDFRAVVTLLEIMDPNFTNGSNDGAPTIIDDWGIGTKSLAEGVIDDTDK